MISGLTQRRHTDCCSGLQFGFWQLVFAVDKHLLSVCLESHLQTPPPFTQCLHPDRERDLEALTGQHAQLYDAGKAAGMNTPVFSYILTHLSLRNTCQTRQEHKMFMKHYCKSPEPGGGS